MDRLHFCLLVNRHCHHRRSITIPIVFSSLSYLYDVVCYVFSESCFLSVLSYGFERVSKRVCLYDRMNRLRHLISKRGHSLNECLCKCIIAYIIIHKFGRMVLNRGNHYFTLCLNVTDLTRNQTYVRQPLLQVFSFYAFSFVSFAYII